MMAPIPGNNREEPDRPEDADSSFDPPQFIVAADSDEASDEEQDADEENAYAGYQVLVHKKKINKYNR